MNTVKPKVLVVDDEPSNLALLSGVLKKLDVEIIQAASGNQAVEQARQHFLALTLMDINMPKINGYEAAHLLLTRGCNKECPVIFITGTYLDEAHRLKAYNCGAIDYIEKPINALILLSKIKIFLRLYTQQTMLENLHQNLKHEFELSKKYREELVIRLSESALNKSDLVRSNARMIQEIAELNRENQKLHDYIEKHLCDLEYSQT